MLMIGMLTKTRDSVKDNNDFVEKLVLPDGYRKSKIHRSSRFVFDQGGKIVATTKESLMGKSGMAAIFRY